MRPEGRAALASLYFDYPTFAAPSDRPDCERRPIVIIGAGPVGLLAALALARDGVASLIVERSDTFNDGSRAICLQRQSFHILERVGAIAPFLEKALGWTTGRSFYRGKPILEFQMAHDANQKFLPMYNLQQQYIEKFLYEAAASSDLIEIRWQTELTGLATEDAGAALTLKDPKGAYHIDGDWVPAADGAHSATRGMLGLRLSGENFEGRY
ncbi:MAG: FAD-dependent monooxygenase [Alphaproteobacteria bacterium]